MPDFLLTGMNIVVGLTLGFLTVVGLLFLFLGPPYLLIVTIRNWKRPPMEEETVQQFFDRIEVYHRGIDGRR